MIELGRYQAGLAREASGEPLLAAASYQEFIASWRDGDGDLPALLDARRRLTALRR